MFRDFSLQKIRADLADDLPRHRVPVLMGSLQPDGVAGEAGKIRDLESALLDLIGADDEQPLFRVTKIHSLQVVEGPQKQACADQQREGERQLPDDEEFPGAQPGGRYMIFRLEALNSHPTHRRYVGESGRRSTTTSKTSPWVTRTTLASSNGAAW